MMADYFHRRTVLATLVSLGIGLSGPSFAAPQHGIAMYGDPALPSDYDHLPYTNPDAPTGGRLVMGEVGSFDSLNPHILKSRL